MIRARAKKIEDVDPRYICCCMYAKVVAAFEGQEFELEDEIGYANVQCGRCGREFKNMSFRWIRGKRGVYSMVALPFVDLDEGK